MTTPKIDWAFYKKFVRPAWHSLKLDKETMAPWASEDEIDERWARALARGDCGKTEKQMKITKDGNYVTRRDKFPVEILATDMGEDYPVLARYLHPEDGWTVLRFDERGRCSLVLSVMDLIETPKVNESLKQVWINDQGYINIQTPDANYTEMKSLGYIRLRVVDNYLVDVEILGNQCHS